MPRTLCDSKPKNGHGVKQSKEKNYVGRGNSPYINLGKGGTLAQKSRESLPSKQRKEGQVVKRNNRRTGCVAK
eukprot:211595-Pelagomonas_calceolata.AAC.1